MFEYTYAKARLIQALNADNQRLRAENERYRFLLHCVVDYFDDGTETTGSDALDALLKDIEQALSQETDNAPLAE